MKKKEKRSAILVNLLKLEISLSLLDIIHIGSSSTASDLKGKNRGSPNWWPFVLRVKVKSNSSNIIDEL